MSGLRRLSATGLALAYVQSVFGAIVRISGSGMGCGEHWPDCNGSVVPAITNYTVAVEATHRVLAAALLATAVALVALAASRRSTPGVGGRGGVLRPAILALVLILTAAIAGMVVVKLSLSNPYVIVVHYSIAMATLATFVVALARTTSRSMAAVASPDTSVRTFRSARAAAGLAFLTVVFGALTANVAGAAQSCRGFPLCRNYLVAEGSATSPEGSIKVWNVDDAAALGIQLTHRALAFLLFLHVVAFAILVTRRGERGPAVRAAQTAALLVVLQIAIAAALVELHLPPALQSLHQAVGTMLWVVLVACAVLAGGGRQPMAATGPAPDAALPRGAPA